MTISFLRLLIHKLLSAWVVIFFCEFDNLFGSADISHMVIRQSYQKGYWHCLEDCDARERYRKDFSSCWQRIGSWCWCAALVKHICLIHQEIPHNLQQFALSQTTIFMLEPFHPETKMQEEDEPLQSLSISPYTYKLREKGQSMKVCYISTRRSHL